MNQYKLASLSPPAVKGDGILEEWIQIYNNSAGDLANGLVKRVSFLVDTGTVSTDATTALPLIVAVPLTVATETTESNIIGVIDNPVETVAGTPITQYDGIKRYSLGWMKLKGVVSASCDGTSADIAIGDQLEVLTTTTTFIVSAAASSGASGALAPETAAIALEAYPTNSAANKWVHLIGRPCQVKAT
jgi:hypothetical protein